MVVSKHMLAIKGLTKNTNSRVTTRQLNSMTTNISKKDFTEVGIIMKVILICSKGTNNRTSTTILISIRLKINIITGEGDTNKIEIINNRILSIKETNRAILVIDTINYKITNKIGMNINQIVGINSGSPITSTTIKDINRITNHKMINKMSSNNRMVEGGVNSNTETIIKEKAIQIKEITSDLVFLYNKLFITF